VTHGLAWWGLPDFWAQVRIQESSRILSAGVDWLRVLKPERRWFPSEPQVAHGEHASITWRVVSMTPVGSSAQP
jgi:hypothetical protein